MDLVPPRGSRFPPDPRKPNTAKGGQSSWEAPKLAQTPAKGGPGGAAGRPPWELASFWGSVHSRRPSLTSEATAAAGGTWRLASPQPGPVQPPRPAPVPRLAVDGGWGEGGGEPLARVRRGPCSPWGRPRGARAGRSTSWCGCCGPRRKASRSAGRSLTPSRGAGGRGRRRRCRTPSAPWASGWLRSYSGSVGPEGRPPGCWVAGCLVAGAGHGVAGCRTSRCRVARWPLPERKVGAPPTCPGSRRWHLMN